jgi:hypothetical protein
MSRALSNRFARLAGNSRGGETGVAVFPLRLDADRAAREADLTRSGLAQATDRFLPIWQFLTAEPFAPYQVAGTRARVHGPHRQPWSPHLRGRLDGPRSEYSRSDTGTESRCDGPFPPFGRGAGRAHAGRLYPREAKAHRAVRRQPSSLRL